MELKLIPISSENFSEHVKNLSSDLPNIETLKLHESKSSKDTILHRIGAFTPDSNMVGFGMAVSGPWDPLLKLGHFEIHILVDKKWRNQGIGNMLFEEVKQFAVDNGGIALQCGVRETKAADIFWLMRRGFNKVLHTFESQLDVTTFYTTQAIEEIESLGVQFTSFAAYPQDDEWLRRFLDFWWVLAKDAPGMEDKPRPEFNFMKKQFENIDREGFILAVKGHQWIAMSMIIKESNDTYYNSLTGVLRKYRGRNIALAVKLKAIEYARQNGAKIIRTHNDSNNIPMLKINQRLGYEKKPGLYFFEKQI